MFENVRFWCAQKSPLKHSNEKNNYFMLSSVQPIQKVVELIGSLPAPVCWLLKFPLLQASVKALVPQMVAIDLSASECPPPHEPAENKRLQKMNE